MYTYNIYIYTYDVCMCIYIYIICIYIIVYGCSIVFGIILPQIRIVLAFFPGTICLVFATVWN